MNGVFLARSMCKDSIVWGSSPCMMSITKIAISQSEDPLERRFEKDSWPGVSMMRRPGTFTSTGETLQRSFVTSRSFSAGKKEAPICCVMPPASPACTFVRRILSRSLVLPVSTCPMMHTMGERRSVGERSFIDFSMRMIRAFFAFSSRASRSASLSALRFSSGSSSESDSESESESLPDSPSSSSSSSSSLPNSPSASLGGGALKL
mmetsp:Transcript_10640/g.26858  ORF Transcript_10640/g.26858 Transcript_10640/m.26858 type:complete len:207 (-) Transcript_10640:124-744(-)